MSFYTFIQMCNQTTLYWFSTYWFRASYPFRSLIHSALRVCSRVKNPYSSLLSPPCLSKLERLLSGKKNPYFPSPPLLSGSLEHNIIDLDVALGAVW
ncbi:hypothetical protein Hanom_Chr12g01130871 [Helianthus anomalus]